MSESTDPQPSGASRGGTTSRSSETEFDDFDPNRATMAALLHQSHYLRSVMDSELSDPSSTMTDMS